MISANLAKLSSAFISKIPFTREVQTSIYKSLALTIAKTMYKSGVLGREIKPHIVLKQGISMSAKGAVSTVLDGLTRPVVVRFLPSFAVKAAQAFFQKNIPAKVLPQKYAENLPVEIVTTVCVTAATASFSGHVAVGAVFSKVMLSLGEHYFVSLLKSAFRLL